MRARPVLLVAAIFGAAAALSVFVISQLPREGEVSPLPPYAEPPTLPGTTPALAAGEAETDGGGLELFVTAGGEPVAGAEVRAYLAVAPAAGERTRGWRRAGVATTDAAGLARVAGPAGTYLASVRAPGLAPARLEVSRVPGEETARADVALAPPAELSGAVRDPSGGPVAGARVLVLPVAAAGRMASAPPEETPAVTTREDGTFEVGGLAPGLHALRVDAPGRHPVERSRVAVPRDGRLALVLEPLGIVTGIAVLEGGRPAAGAAIVAASRDHAARAQADGDGRFTLTLPTGTYRVIAGLGELAGSAGPLAVAPGERAPSARLSLGQAASIEGEVVEAGSTRAAGGAAVAVALHETGEVVARAAADAAGRFRVTGLAPGAYDLRAEAAGRSPARASGVTLAPGARFPLRLALQPTGTASGAVTDGAGRAVAGARVRVVTDGDRLGGSAEKEARTDFEGRFEVTGLEPGPARITARQAGAASGVTRSVGVRAAGVTDASLVLPEPGLLTGRVAAPEGRPPAGTAVVAVPARTAAASLEVARALADASGNYVLALPAGEYRVYAASAEETRTDPRVSPMFARVDAGRTTRLDLALAAPAADEGELEIVVVEPGGAPSPGAEVTLGRPGDATVAIATAAGDDGRVALGADMGLGGREASVRARNGGRIGSWAGTLPERGTVAVKLSPPGAVEGVVRGPSGARVSGFTLEVSSRPGAGAWRTVDVHRFAGDRFTLGDLPAEPLRIVVRTTDGRRGEVDVELGAGETRPVEIAIR